jgi:hypothetical protein
MMMMIIIIIIITTHTDIQFLFQNACLERVIQNRQALKVRLRQGLKLGMGYSLMLANKTKQVTR